MNSSENWALESIKNPLFYCTRIISTPPSSFCLMDKTPGNPLRSPRRARWLSRRSQAVGFCPPRRIFFIYGFLVRPRLARNYACSLRNRILDTLLQIDGSVHGFLKKIPCAYAERLLSVIRDLPRTTSQKSISAAMLVISAAKPSSLLGIISLCLVGLQIFRTKLRHCALESDF